MADKKKMSVEEILAACRRMDSAGGSRPEGTESATAAQPPATELTPAELTTMEPAPAPPPVAESPAASASEPDKASAATPAKKPGGMTTAEILAAARAGKASPSAKSEAPSAKSEGPSGEGGAKPAAKPPAKPGSMSTADILAAARAGKAGGSKPAAEPSAAKAPAAKAPAAKAPAAKAPAAKAAESTAAKPAADKPAGPRDTASILAAARAAAKPGPISKAEAAARDKEAAPPKSKKKEVPPMPEKPAYAQPIMPAPVLEGDRRGFLRGTIAAFSGSALAVGFSSLAVTFNLWTLGFARFMFPNILTEPPTKFKVGFPDELAPGQVQTKYVAQFGVWIVRYEYDGEPEIYALQTVCTHLGCTPNWLEGEQKFKCPCHGSGFYKDGINFEGPAPRPLERFAIRLADDGQLEVDKSRKFKEELGQWRDAASYVPV